MTYPLGVEPLKLRMLGAIFWAGLLVYFVPIWFMNPVDFSPSAVPTQTMPLVVEAPATAALSAVAAAESVVQQQEQSTLFIDKPLTTTPPPADPARVRALHQPASAREAEADVKGHLHVSSNSERSWGPVPETSTSGHVWLQVATYSMENMALDAQSRLSVAGFPSKVIAAKNKKGKVIYLLRAGAYRSRADAKKAKTIVDAHFKIKSVVIGK